jgi:predicted nucleic acid-binding protein
MNLIVVSDASLIILLEKIKLLDKLIKEFKIIIPKEVEKEAILFGKEKNYPDAFRLEEKKNNNLIMVKEVKNQQFVNKIMNDFNIARGESEAICLFKQEKADLLATDDKFAFKACSALSIPVSGSSSFVTQAFDNNLIKKDEAIDMMEILAKEGRYKDEIIFNALNHIRGVKK